MALFLNLAEVAKLLRVWIPESFSVDSFDTHQSPDPLPGLRPWTPLGISIPRILGAQINIPAATSLPQAPLVGARTFYLLQLLSSITRVQALQYIDSNP